MPLYVYQVIEPDGSEGEIFELLQEMSEQELTHHPENGKAVVKLLGAPNAPRKWGEGNMRDKMSNSNLERLGFTKYQKSGGGTYEKTAGKGGPNVISGD
jgi:predicted nucleic acid-binding Zn ribbon protein